MSTGRVEVRTTTAPPPVGSYSQGIIHGGLLYLAGQGPFDLAGRKCPASFREEAERAFGNLAAVARAAGADLRDAVQVRVYLSDMANFAALNEIMPAYFGDPLPARTTIPVALNGFQIEVDAVVALRQDGDGPAA